MCVRVSASIVAFVLAWGLAATAEAQLLTSPPAPAFDPAASPFNLRTNSLFDVSGPPEGGPYEGRPHAASMFAAGQIVDRPTADLRPRFHWGVIGSFIPHWSIPGNMGNLFFENQWTAPKMSGRDVRIGVVRARQLGFEMGVSFVRKTVTSLDFRYQMKSSRHCWLSVVHRTRACPHDGRRRAPGDSVRAHWRTGTARDSSPVAEWPGSPRRRSRCESRDRRSMRARTPSVALTTPPATGGFVGRERTARSGHDVSGSPSHPCMRSRRPISSGCSYGGSSRRIFCWHRRSKSGWPRGSISRARRRSALTSCISSGRDASAQRRRSRIRRVRRHPPLKSRTGRR